MTISHELSQSGLVFYFTGELDHHTAHEAITYVSQQISLNRSKSVEMNFKGVTFMDSSGLAVVLNAKRLTDRSGNRLRVHDVPPHAMKIFRAAQLDKMIPFA